MKRSQSSIDEIAFGLSKCWQNHPSIPIEWNAVVTGHVIETRDDSVDLMRPQSSQRCSLEKFGEV